MSVVDEMATAVVEVIREALQPRDAMVNNLAKRVTELEHRAGGGAPKPYVKFCGVWKPSELAFDPGDAVVHHSALWICKAETKGEPGVDFVGWQLAIKSPPRR